MKPVCPERHRLVGFLLGLAVSWAITWCGLAVSSGAALAQTALPAALYPVGMKQMQYTGPAEGGRPLAFALFYPAAVPDNTATPYKMTFFTNLHLYVDAPIAADQFKRPLIMFSHGAGSNGLYYAWFGEYLASHGYIVAMLYHYRANTYDSTVMYTRSKLWQRPRDISLDITGLLKDPAWEPHIDADKIGAAGTRRAASLRCGSVAPESTPICFSPIRPFGGTTRWCRPTCARNCRSTRSLRATWTMDA